MKKWILAGMLGLGLCLFMPQQRPLVLGSEKTTITKDTDDQVFELTDKSKTKPTVAIFDERRPEGKDVTILYLEGDLNTNEIVAKQGIMHTAGLSLIAVSSAILIIDSIKAKKEG